MTHDFEDELRRALRPLEAPAGFAARVMSALPEQRTGAEDPTRRPAPATPKPARPQPAPSWQRFGAPAALAASLLVAVLLGQQMAFHHQQREDLAGRAASQELLQALRVTSQKLDLAYQAVKSPPAAESEENRS